MSQIQPDNDNFNVWKRRFDRSCSKTELKTPSQNDKDMSSGYNPDALDSIIKQASDVVDFQMDKIKNELLEREAHIHSVHNQILKRVNLEFKPDAVDNGLKQKYQEALKKDEKLEAEANRSINEINYDMVKRQGKLKKLHVSQVKEYLLVQDKLKASFSKDMDELINKFDSEFSRFKKDNAQLLAGKPIRQKNKSITQQ